MSRTHAQFSLWLIALLFLTLSPRTTRAQTSVSKTGSVAGCLQKGVEPGGFYIDGENGTMWELSGKVDAAHVGHKVTVNGQVLRRSAAEEAKFSDYEKQESRGKPYADFQVTSLKMVSNSCQ